MNILKNRIVLLVLISALLGGVAYQVYAFTTTNLRAKVQSVRYRVTAADVIAGVSPEPLGSLREVTLFRLQAGDQILSWVSNVTSPFIFPPGSLGELSVVTIQARQNGIPISQCDVALPPILSYVNFEHRLGSCLEYAFYDDTNPTDIVLTFGTNTNLDLATLNPTSGQVDFIVTKVE